MSNNVKRRLPKRPKGDIPPAVINEEVEEFARRLNMALRERRMSQSDLARKVWNRMTVDNRGYQVVWGRDKISAYVNGKIMPEPQTLTDIADALGVPEEELAPNLTADAIEREHPEVLLQFAQGHSDKALLRIRKILPLEIATEIVKLINDYEKSK